jgi:hypothetical protein
MYTAYGGVMVIGGLLFTVAAWRAAQLTRVGVGLFGAGLLVNLILAALPAPDILQTVGTLLRNLGLIAMGADIMAARVRPSR